MAKKINSLSDKDVETLRVVAANDRRRIYNTQGRGHDYLLDSQDYLTPETYIALTPSSGIGPLTEDVGTATESSSVDRTEDDSPGYAECSIYRLLPNSEGRPLLTSVPGLSHRVHNITGAKVPGKRWILITRDKYGDWVYTGQAVCSEPKTFVTNVCPTGGGNIRVEYSLIDLSNCRVITMWCVDNPTGCCAIIPETGTWSAGTGTSTPGPVLSPCMPGVDLPLVFCFTLNPVFLGGCTYATLKANVVYAGILGGSHTWTAQFSQYIPPNESAPQGYQCPNIIEGFIQIQIPAYTSGDGVPPYTGCVTILGGIRYTRFGLDQTLVIDSTNTSTTYPLAGWTNSPIYWPWRSPPGDFSLTYGPCAEEGTWTGTGGGPVSLSCCPGVSISRTLTATFSGTSTTCTCLTGTPKTMEYTEETGGFWRTGNITCGSGTMKFYLNCSGADDCSGMQLGVYCNSSLIAVLTPSPCTCDPLSLTYNLNPILGDSRLGTLCGSCVVDGTLTLTITE